MSFLFKRYLPKAHSNNKTSCKGSIIAAPRGLHPLQEVFLYVGYVQAVYRVSFSSIISSPS